MINKKMIPLLILFACTFNLTYPLPRFALRYNDKCSNCHFNPTGGLVRNEDGFTFGRNIVSMFSSSGKEVPISPRLSNNVTFGFDYRTQFLFSGEKKRGDFQDMSGAVYLNVAMSEDINLITRYDFVQSIWEGYAVAGLFKNQAYIKAGSFVPDFGIHLDDHTAYTRGGDFGLLFAGGAIRGLLFNPFYTVTGVEFGASINKSIGITASIGKNKASTIFNSDPVFTSRIAFTPDLGKLEILAGGSFSAAKTKYFDAASGEQDLLPSNLYGFFGGIGYERFTIMGEYDLASDYLKRGTVSQTFMIETAYQLMVGLEAVMRYDRFIPDKNITGDYYSHLVMGFEFFPYSFIELRPQYRINMHDPLEKSNSFVMQLHFYY